MNNLRTILLLLALVLLPHLTSAQAINADKTALTNFIIRMYKHATFEVKVDEQMVELPPKEFAILKYLIEHQNRVVEREVLLTRIWGYDYEGNERVVDNHVKKLRKALGDAGKQIKTVITKGYKLEGER